ncbi:hypothetical protein I8J29_13015 [Paenibacillus sp. MWE-103]|uniref:Uncharacterized protein n=1 Tax=Paenibacillus artemisiicola TaxID=1172618 RepID=A0ABS3WA31_9BACL|nr:DUF948 domain-containing protein [Paenibacillus artemisiicola]MBO7745123.1 hypothetical protein [Paenibacillus artemisiicola]
MNKIAGLIVFAFTFLTAALIVTLAQLSQNTDEIDGSYGGLWDQVPPIVYLLLFIPLFIGAYLFNRPDTDKS